MACFVVSGGEAIVVNAVQAAARKHEREAGIIDENDNQLSDARVSGVCWTRKLNWLKNMLVGGVFLLLIEHIWHGEVTFFPPFLTAMLNPEDTAEMLHEIATVGVGMAVLVTAVWFVATLVIDFAIKRAEQSSTEKA